MTQSLPTPNFLILTSRLLLLPTPHAITLPSYRSLYASLHASPEFCTTAFGDREDSFKPVVWDDEMVKNSVIGREVKRSWEVRGMGDFGVGVLSDGAFSAMLGDSGVVGGGSERVAVGDGERKFVVVEGKEMQRLMGLLRDAGGGGGVSWIGYAGVRDATTTSIPAYAINPLTASESSSTATSPPWQEMIELRYGLDSSSRGKGYGSEAAKAVMAWCEEKRGARRFIAECEVVNQGSRGILRKLGFKELEGLGIWGSVGTVEWERVVGGS